MSRSQRYLAFVLLGLLVLVVLFALRAYKNQSVVNGRVGDPSRFATEKVSHETENKIDNPPTQSDGRTPVLDSNSNQNQQPLDRSQLLTQVHADYLSYLLKNLPASEYESKIGKYLRELTKADLPFLSDLYQKCVKRERFMTSLAAFGMVCSCGGEEVSAFLYSRLTDPAVSQVERENLLAAISSDAFMYTPKRVPVTEDLLKLARELYGGQKSSLERAAGVRLLGGVPSDEHRSLLVTLSNQDADLKVRMAAIRGLGTIGDASTLKYLQSYEGNYLNQVQSVQRQTFKIVLDSAISELSGTLAERTK